LLLYLCYLLVFCGFALAAQECRAAQTAEHHLMSWWDSYQSTNSPRHVVARIVGSCAALQWFNAEMTIAATCGPTAKTLHHDLLQFAMTSIFI